MNGISEKEKENIEYLTQLITHKLLHKPSVNLKKNADAGIYSEAVKTIFELE